MFSEETFEKITLFLKGSVMAGHPQATEIPNARYLYCGDYFIISSDNNEGVITQRLYELSKITSIKIERYVKKED